MLTPLKCGLEDLWRSWYLFRQGKRRSPQLDHFSYYLEDSLYQLYRDIQDGTYRHGDYERFVVTDSKRRKISVASIRDRVVHRLLYEYLVPIYDKTFIYDAWSCRKNKGLIGAINRTQRLLGKYSRSYVWRTDINKFFDSVDQDKLLKMLGRKITDKKALGLLREVIESYSALERERESNERAARHGNRQFNQSNFCQYLLA